MKGLMFFAAGSVLHGAGTKDMERLGGLMKRMPWTGAAMMVGAVAIAALPPFNGFVSEWLMYLSLAESGLATAGGRSLAAFLAVGLLALVGGLAAVAFVRLTGIVLLGSPRSEAAAHAHESSPWMLAPIGLLVALCLAVAVFPGVVAVPLPRVLDQALGPGAGAALAELEASEAPLRTLGAVNAWTVLALTALSAVVVTLCRRPARAEGPTWGCGYVRPTVRMQYTGRSFAEMMAEHLLPRFLRPRTSRRLPRGLFPTEADFGARCPDPLAERVYEPFFRRWAERFARLRILQQGKVNVYLLYIVLTVVFALTWVSVRR
jgi:NADH:ubiquinone oxidoreductase subunit 5 (subunit L)/multisubunit Na+/H+ antiporter MnhA subunit